MLKNIQVCCIVILNSLYCGTVTAANFEPEELSLKAADLLGSGALSGPHYRIDDNVVTKGYMNQYTINSDFGKFDASSDEQLAIRIHEIAAIAELQTLKKSDVFANAIAETAKMPVKAIKNVVEDPVETLKGIPQGVGRLFKRTKRQLEDANETLKEYNEEKSKENGGESTTSEMVDKGMEQGEKLTKSYLGQNKSIRKLAKQLKVDPYSANQILQDEMSEVAWVMTAGSFGTSQIMPDIPDAIGQLSDVNELVWDTNPVDLQLQNEKLLRNMAVSEKLIEDFYDNKFFTTTLRTRLVGSLEGLGDVPGRFLIVKYAAAAATKAEARLYGKIAETLLLYHKSRNPVISILDSSVWPVAKSSGNNLLLIVPVDYLVWTENVSVAARELTQQVRNSFSSSQREIWIEGQISDLARSEMTTLGWVVFDKSKSRL